MLEGVDDTELEAYLDDHPRIVPLFEIDIIETIADYAPTNTLLEEAYEPDPESIIELSRAVAAFEREMEISWRVVCLGIERSQCRNGGRPSTTFDCKRLTSKS